MTRETINPPELFNSVQYGFSQITINRGTRFVSLSGQVAWDANGEIVGAGNLREQTFQTFKNIELAMQKAGGTLDDIASMRIYIVQSEMEKSAAVKEGLLHFFPDNPPATTWIGVQGLANAEFLIEIEVFAVLE